MEKERTSSNRTLSKIADIWSVYTNELRRVFHDKGVVTIFFVAGLIYPLLYPLIYYHEAVEDIPIAVVDRCDTQHSREYMRKLDATREVNVAYHCMSLQEAEQLYHQHKCHGVIYIPDDFEYQIETVGGQAVVSVYCDMSSFLYYKALVQASNFVMLDEHHAIQVKRYELLGNDKAMAETLAQPLRYESVMLYNPGGGYPSFLLPAILILILFQTMFFGICMLAGVTREQNGELYLINGSSEETSTFRLVLGRGLAYFTIYLAITVYVVGLVPRIFGLPHIGDFFDLLRFMVPFLLATAFYSMTVSVFIRERETAMVVLLFSSVVLLFLSGCSWPTSNMPAFWRLSAKLFPSTYGINGYIHINSCGASLFETRHEYIALWIQALCYLVAACVSYKLSGWIYTQGSKRKEQQAERIDRLEERFGANRNGQLTMTNDFDDDNK